MTRDKREASMHLFNFTLFRRLIETDAVGVRVARILLLLFILIAFERRFVGPLAHERLESALEPSCETLQRCTLYFSPIVDPGIELQFCRIHNCKVDFLWYNC